MKHPSILRRRVRLQVKLMRMSLESYFEKRTERIKVLSQGTRKQSGVRYKRLQNKDKNKDQHTALE